MATANKKREAVRRGAGDGGVLLQQTKTGQGPSAIGASRTSLGRRFGSGGSRLPTVDSFHCEATPDGAWSRPVKGKSDRGDAKMV